jgi:small-conductance mechanosensitive channel
MTTLSKLLVVLVAILSVAFMGFAGVTTLGGPNWRAMAGSMKDYAFSQSEGDNPQWSVTSASGESLKTSAVLPEVLVGAMDHKLGQQKTELDALTAQEPQVRERLQGFETSIEADKLSLQASLEANRARLAQLQQQYEQISRQVVQKTDEAQQVEQVVAARRTDVFRSTNQLEVLRADRALIGQLRRQMDDLIQQINADLEKASRRNRQLLERLGEKYSE